MTRLRARPGASLAATLAALILIECVILGTLHLAMAERQVAAAAAGVLRLRLAADGALAEASLHWPQAASELPVGGETGILEADSPDGLRTVASLRRIGGTLFLLRATAAERAPAVGHAAASMLLLPPLLSAEFEIPVALDAAALMELLPGWPLPPQLDSVLQRVATGRHRLAGRSGALLLEDGAEMAGEFQGVVLAPGDLLLRAGAVIHGFVFAAGTISVEDGAQLRGAFIASAVVTSAAFLDADPAVAGQAVVTAGMRRPDAAPGRSRLPGF